MGFADDLYRLATQIATRKQHCKGNEEATKHSLILPLLQVLGYDIHDPSELVPEYRAGWAANREKVDYAIFLNNAPAIFVEAKAHGVQLDNYDAQLAKYFNSVPELKIAVISDGVRYKFFSDLKNPNIMDPEPFFEFDLEAATVEEIVILKSFRRDGFNPGEVLVQAENLGYLKALNRKCRTLFREPSEDFVRFLAADIFPRRMTPAAIERLVPLVRQAMTTAIVDMVSQGLIQEIAKPHEAAPAPAETPPEVRVEIDLSKPEPTLEKAGDERVVTTEEELAAFEAVCRIIREGIGDDRRIGYKDTGSYFGVQLEKPSKWFMRLHFNSPKKKFVAFRVPVAQAAALLPEGLKAEDYGGHAHWCRIDLQDLAQLQAMKNLILLAYREIAAPAAPASPAPETSPVS